MRVLKKFVKYSHRQHVIPRLDRGIPSEFARSRDPAIKSRDDGIVFLRRKLRGDDYTCLRIILPSGNLLASIEQYF
jgi:hypothetical protein